MKFELGIIARDIITGFTGRIVGRSDYMTGCNVYLLVPKSSDVSKRPEGEWFDEDRLEVVNPNRLVLGNQDSKPGSDIMAPTK